MAAPCIPRSKLWDTVRETIKPALRAAAGRRLYAALTGKAHWTLVFLNYLAMRHPWLGRLLGSGAWPESLFIEGTNICSARCVFCAYPQMERPKQVMTMELFEKTIAQYAAAGGGDVDLTPIVGDPFADRFLFERLDALAALPGIRRFHFFTNAILMTPATHARLAAYGERIFIYVSLGGFDRETYRRIMGVDRFDEAAANLRGLIETKRRTGSRLGIQVNLRVPPGSARGGFWDELVRARRDGLIAIESLEAFDSWAGKISESGLKAAGLKALAAPEKIGPCHRLITSPVVLADGRVNACACRDVEASLIIGDLNRQTIGEALDSAELHALLERQARGDFPEVCRRCTYYASLYPGWLRATLFPLFSRLFR